ncbi:MerR family transcriptional regulator [Rhodococcus sp. MEB064]|uniref:MerR family transcriptional regulator n=1 Tax=Rhodococcus sp. MEB064 TaxID=1587522 RepID=UPI0018CE173E|nr:MerR family transcriptional regulator [Rhodococcus sp. MEB064]
MPVTEYRIDDLAREAGVSVRNVRVYQDRGLLPPPRKVGRTGWYDESHLARLQMISRMLDRGYTFVTISELLTAAQYGLRVEDVLGTEDPDGAATVDRSVYLSRSDIDAMFDGRITDVELGRAQKLDVFTAEGDGFRVANPALVRAAKVLFDAGLALTDILDRTERVHSDLTSVSKQFVRLVVDRFVPGGADPFLLEPSELSAMADLITTLRPLAAQAVQALFTEAMDAEIVHAMETALDGATPSDSPGSDDDTRGDA